MITGQLYEVTISHANKSAPFWIGDFVGEMPTHKEVITAIKRYQTNLREDDYDHDEVAYDIAAQEARELDALLEMIPHLPGWPSVFCSKDLEVTAKVCGIVVGKMNVKRREVYLT